MKNKIVYVIGAGFSVRAGIPPQKKLLPLIKNLEPKEMGVGGVSSPAIINNIFLPYIYAKNPHLHEDASLEDIYTLLDSSVLKNKRIGIFDTKSLINIRVALDRCVLKVIQKNLSVPVIAFYKKKIASYLITYKNVSFISTNWDSLLETILEKLDCKVDFSFNEISNSDNKKILVLKPHGSLNWKYCPNCGHIYIGLESEYIKECRKCVGSEENVMEFIRKYENLAQSSLERNLFPLFITPTFMKNSIIPQINMVFNKMLSELSSAQEINFIGYSLPLSDHDIRDVLIRANIINNEAKIKVLLFETNKDSKEQLKNNYLSIYDSKRVTFDFKGLRV
jgi:NAD-dependent SIR2 family protein deacetylase